MGLSHIGPAVTFAGRPRQQPVNPTPGPADYRSHSTAGKDMPAFTIYGRWVYMWALLAYVEAV